jgi:hypothetical protein
VGTPATTTVQRCDHQRHEGQAKVKLFADFPLTFLRGQVAFQVRYVFIFHMHHGTEFFPRRLLLRRRPRQCKNTFDAADEISMLAAAA